MRFFIMDHTGHSTVEFDKANKVDLDAAMAQFDDLVKNKKNIAATRTAGERDYIVTKSFDDLKDETLFRPQNVGG